MKTVVNRPLAATFGWLGVNGTTVEAPEAEQTHRLAVAPGQERTLVLQDGSPALRVWAEVGPGGVLRVIQLRRGGAARTVSSLRVVCRERARFEWYRVVLGGGETYDDCSAELKGEGSAFSALLGYRLGGEEKLDVNCEAIHTGKRTKSDIRASGALSGQAVKLLRGTIDFRRGCAGAEGTEAEDVLLLEETVRNQSVPVILCAEEDVAGDHAATIGRPDGETLFYLASRGVPEAEAMELLAKSKLDAVLRALPDPALRRELLGEEDGR